MQPEELVTAAKTLLDKPSASEAEYRAAAHACYYAALHMAAPYVGVDVENDRKRHANVRDRLANKQFILKAPSHIVYLANYFTDLARLRIKADYQLDDTLTLDEADQALEWMQGVLEKMPK